MPPQNPFLEGSFARVAEEITAFDRRSPAACPPGSADATCATGPTRSAWGDAGYRWFLGAGMVHGV